MPFNSRQWPCCSAFVGGCGGGDTTDSSGPGHVPNSDATLTISPTSLTLIQGKSATATLTLSRKGSGSQGTVTIVAPVLSRGVTATFGSTVAHTGNFFDRCDAFGRRRCRHRIEYPGLRATRRERHAGHREGPWPSLSLHGEECATRRDGVQGRVGIRHRHVQPRRHQLRRRLQRSFDAAPVTLTAVPAAGSAFASWAGACVGTALTCTFTPRPAV